VIIGNPPWNGRTGQLTTAQNWTASKGYLAPAKDIAWGFVWKALEGIKPTGLVAFLLPAMGILHNTESQAARRMLLQRTRIRRIINMSDLCFQLFDGAQRPTALVLYGPQKQGQAPYRFEYWVPKADLNLRLKRLVTLSLRLGFPRFHCVQAALVDTGTRRATAAIPSYDPAYKLACAGLQGFQALQG